LFAVIGRISSLSALVAAILAPIYAVGILGFEESALAVLLMSLVLIWRHQSNIVNLMAGKEARIGEKSSSDL
ncbi:MAG: glycerol-3-phosphate acyltransferase, partial [Pseudomonadota bacterium]